MTVFRSWNEVAISTIALIHVLSAAQALDQISASTGRSSPNRTLEEQRPGGELNCAQGYRGFNEQTQKKIYHVGVHAPAGVDKAYREYNMTFETYLNEAVGKRWDPPIEFKMTATDSPLLDWLDKGDEVDFMYTDTGIYSCIGTEIGSQPLGNTIARSSSRGLDYDLDIFAGTMIVLAGNNKINSIADLKGKVIGAQAFSDFAGAQAQFFMMNRQNVDFIVDPNQVIFTGNNDDTVQGVLDGRWDVGFVRTGHIGRTINPATGDFVDPRLVKVLDPKIHIMDDGSLFPFLHSTPVFPEWPLSAKDDVDRIVSEEVAQAMINFQYHHLVGEKIHDCREEATSDEEMSICNTMPPAHFYPDARCDTTRALAELAYRAGTAGFHAGFRPPRSHFSVRTMQQDAGFIVEDENGDWRCERASGLYDGIMCPDDHYKVGESDFEKQCERAGRPCPEGYSCYCQPCVKAFEVTVFPRQQDGAEGLIEFDRFSGCDKMDVCGTVQQRKEIFFQAFDNRNRGNVTVTAIAHLGDEVRDLQVHQVEPFLYEFGFSDSETGVSVVEIFFDGVQIPESPFQVQIEARNCDIDFPRQGRIPNVLGGCECAFGTIEISGDCVSTEFNEVSVFQWDSANETHTTFEFMRDAGCSKMSLCATAEQTQEIVFRAFDNRQRDNVTIAALMHLSHEEIYLEVRQVERFLYEFSFVSRERGVEILEVYIDGVQIPESPVRVQVVSRDCDMDFPDLGMIANGVGICECPSDSIEIGGKCVPTGTFSAIMASIGLLLAVQLGWCYIRYKRRKSDEVWHVNHDELDFSHPVEVIGQGAFGVVLLADYRGTKVAIKRVLPLQPKVKTKGTGSVQSVPSDKAGRDMVEPNIDPESGLQFGSSRRQPSATSSADEDESSSDDFEFLGGLTMARQQNMLQRWLPSFFADNSTRSKLNILGTASGGSATPRSLLGMILPRCDENSRRHEEFLTEMRLLSRLRHPCITTIMGAIMTSHDPMMVMEYMENGSLYDLLRNETVYTGGDIILQIVRDIAQGLRFLHASKPPILHRDLKAKNILIDSRFRAKVADFGLSTKTKDVLSGTPFWMAPEYLQRKTQYNAACDIYAFGMIIYEIYSRKIPYEGEHPRKVLRKVCDSRINYRPPVPGTCPKRMVDVMKKCWGQNSSFRPEAKELDMTFTDMTSNDAEPLVEEGNTRLRTEVAAGDMLYKVFPKKVADQLKAGQKVEPESHDNVTVFFSDIVRFTDISRALSPVKVCQMLDRLYLAFDSLANKHEVFKVETIGDAWVGVTNLEGNQNDSHTRRIAEFAVDAIAAAGNVVIDEDDPSAGNVHIRVGFHSGQVVSNVIGSLNPRYGLFGDTVNTASRMESLSLSGKIHCSAVSAKLLKEQAPKFPLRKRGKVAVKGKGSMATYWVGSSSMAKEESHGAGGAFDEKPVVGFKYPESRSGDKNGVQGRPPTMITTDGALKSAFKDDPSHSAPTAYWKEITKKEKRRAWLYSSGSSSYR